MVLIRGDVLREYGTSYDGTEWKYAGWYDLRLWLSRKGRVVHLNEYPYTEQELDTRLSGEKQFDYVNPRNSEVQVEMEKVVTRHLDAIAPSSTRRHTPPPTSVSSISTVRPRSLSPSSTVRRPLPMPDVGTLTADDVQI